MEPDKSSEHVLEDGTKVTVRPIRPTDAELLRAGFARLSPESRYRRFFAGVSELSDETVRYLTQVDGYNHVAIVAVVDSLDLKVEDGLGVARFIRLQENPEIAEAAVTVMDQAQRKGLGKILLGILVEKAREIGVKRFRAEVLADNEPMMRLLMGAGASMHTSNGNTVIFDVPIEDATAHAAGEPSLVERVLHAAAESLSVLLRTLRPPPLDESAPVLPEPADTSPREGDGLRKDEEGHT